MKKLIDKNIPNYKFSAQLAQQIVDDYLKDSDTFVLSLQGGLGAGKTFFVQEMLKHLGVTEEINSPTYTLVNEYEVEKQRYAHFDFYRMSDPNDFFARGFQDMADDETVSCFIEWPQKLSEEAKSAFTGKKYVLTIDFGIGVGMRKVKLLEEA